MFLRLQFATTLSGWSHFATTSLDWSHFVTGFSVLFFLFVFFIIDQSTFSDAKITLFFQLSMQKSKMLHRKREFLRYKGMDD
jgi:hypothetical protein